MEHLRHLAMFLVCLIVCRKGYVGPKEMVNRSLMWGFLFIWLEIRPFNYCSGCRCQRIKFPLVACGFYLVLSSGFPGDIFLNKVWDVQLFPCVIPCVMGTVVGSVGEGKWHIMLWVGVSLTVSLECDPHKGLLCFVLFLLFQVRQKG